MVEIPQGVELTCRRAIFDEPFFHIELNAQLTLGLVFQQNVSIELSPKGQSNMTGLGVSEYHALQHGLMMSDPCI
jgi:hypothetical protein